MRVLLTHQRFMDVFIEIIRVTYKDDKRVKGKLVWWNRSQTGCPFVISTMQNFEFTREKWNEFVPYKEGYEGQRTDS